MENRLGGILHSKMKKGILFFVIGALIIGIISFLLISNLHQEKTSSFKLSGLSLVNTSLENSMGTASKEDIEIRVEKTNIKNGFKEDIFVKNKGEAGRYNFSRLIEIDYPEVRWHGTKYKLSDEPIKFGTITSREGKELIPNIFMDDVFNKRISYDDVALNGGYALAYKKGNKYYIELRIDNMEIPANQEIQIDPTYTNQTNGFPYTNFANGAVVVRGGTTNNSYHWIEGNTVLNKLTIAGVNQTGACSLAENGALQTNGSSTHVINNGATLLKEYDRNCNLLNSYDISARAGMVAPIGLGANVSAGTIEDFWSSSQNKIYHLNRTGANVSTAFSTLSCSTGDIRDVMPNKNGSIIYAVTNTGAFCIFNSLTGANLTGGFSLASEMKMGDMRAMWGNFSDFYIGDEGDYFAYDVYCDECYLPDTDANPSVVLDAPANNSNFIVSTTWFNGTAEDDVNITNISLFINGIRNYTFEYGHDNRTNLTLWRSIVDGVYNWTMEACDNSTAGHCRIAGNRTFTIDTGAPLVNITSVQNTTYIDIFGNYTKTIYLNFSVSDPHIESCWYFNATENVSIVCGQNATLILPYGAYQFYFYANDTLGNEGSYNVSANWIYKILQTSLDYNSNTYETKEESLIFGFKFIAGLEVSLAQLNYNSINYTISNVTYNGTDYIFNRKINIPLNNNPFLNQSNNFSLIFTYEGSNISTSAVYPQNSSFINLQLCNATYNISALNFTLYNEKTLEKINAATNLTTFQSTFKYWMGDGSIYKNYSYQSVNSSTISNYSFCIFPWNNQTLKTTMTAVYSAVGFAEREYNLYNSMLTNAISHISLYLLDVVSYQKFTITVKQGVSNLPDALVTVSKYFLGEGNYKIMAIRKTDTSGQFVEYLELDKDYRYSVSVSGILRKEIDRRASCNSVPCEFTLQIDGDQGNVFKGYNEYFANSTNSSMVFNPSTKIVTYNFSDITGSAHYFRLVVEQVNLNHTQTTVCDSYSYSSSGSITCNVTGYSGDFMAKGYNSRSPEKVDIAISFMIGDLLATLGKLSLFISLAIIITITFAAGMITGGSPSGFIFGFGVSVLGTKLMTIFPFSWIVVIAIELLVIILIAEVKQ